MNKILGDKTDKMLLATENDVFNNMVGPDDPFQQLNKMFDFNELALSLADCYSELGATGLAIEKGFRALLVQFWEDYSDRQMEKSLRNNVAVRWFCGFGLLEKTPDHSFFGKLRQRIGPHRLAEIFHKTNEAMKKKNLFGEVFTFLDASSIITKTALWEERDKAIKAGEEKLNNLNVHKYSADPDARWGAKSKTNFWYGYKRHNAVDMRHGLIAKVSVTPANTSDHRGGKDTLPNQGMVFADKAYDCREFNQAVKERGCVSAIIRKNNNKRKNFDLDGWHSKVRMPFESTFSKQNKHTRYKGLAKTKFQCVAEALVYNLKKALRVLSSLATADNMISAVDG